MTVLDDRPTFVSPVRELMPDRQPSDARWDAVVRAVGAAPLWLRLTDRNPVNGRTYAESVYWDLPYMVCVLIRRSVLTTCEWDALVSAGRTLDVMGNGPHRLPFAMTPPPGLPPLPPEDQISDGCADCGGTGLAIDDDVSMTGTRDAVFLCWCSGDPL